MRSYWVTFERIERIAVLVSDRDGAGVRVGLLLDGFEDAHVAGAAAEISGEAFLDLYQCWVRVFFEQMVRGEDHAGGADAALGSAFSRKHCWMGWSFFALGLGLRWW